MGDDEVDMDDVFSNDRSGTSEGPLVGSGSSNQSGIIERMRDRILVLSSRSQRQTIFNFCGCFLILLFLGIIIYLGATRTVVVS